MGAVYFYHLTERPLEATLPTLLGKSLAAGWRVAVLGPTEERIKQLDSALWQGEGFLPHGLAGGPHDDAQPILLTTADLPDGVNCLMAIDGAEFDLSLSKSLERTCVLFDGGNEAVLEKARTVWKDVSAAGIEAQYWAEDGGRWVKKAENAPEC